MNSPEMEAVLETARVQARAKRNTQMEQKMDELEITDFADYEDIFVAMSQLVESSPHQGVAALIVLNAALEIFRAVHGTDQLAASLHLAADVALARDAVANGALQ